MWNNAAIAEEVKNMDEIEKIWKQLSEDDKEAKRLAHEFILQHQGKLDTARNLTDIKKEHSE